MRAWKRRTKAEATTNGKTSSVSSYSAVVKWTNYKFLWAGGLECDRSVGERKRSKCFDGRFMCWLVKIADTNRSRPEWWICCGCRYCHGESQWLKAVNLHARWAWNLGKLSWKFLKSFSNLHDDLLYLINHSSLSKYEPRRYRLWSLLAMAFHLDRGGLEPLAKKSPSTDRWSAARLRVILF